MTNNVRIACIRKYATRELNRRSNCQHAVYGKLFITDEGDVVQYFAPTPDDILYFNDDASLREYITKLKKTNDFFSDIYAVHKHNGALAQPVEQAAHNR